MLKKIFIISSVLLITVLVFFGIYMLAFKKTDNIQTKKINKKNIVDVAKIASKKITNITSDSVVSATLGPNGDTLRYCDAVDGRVWTMTLRGTNKEVLFKKTKGVPNKFRWSTDGNQAIASYDDGKIFVYNYTTGVDIKLRDGMDDVVWAGNSGRILYKYYDKKTKERSLNIANADGTNWKKLADLPFRYTTFTQIPSSILASFWPTEDANVQTALFTTSTIHESIPKQIFSQKYGADFLFSSTGKKVLVSSVAKGGKQPTLAIMDNDGQNYNDLLIPTIVKKTVWSQDGKTVYYAQPNNVPSDVVWPNDYNDRKFIVQEQDTFYKLDIETGKKERIVELNDINEKIDAVDLFLDKSESVLFFVNRTNGLLYRISL